MGEISPAAGGARARGLYPAQAGKKEYAYFTTKCAERKEV